MTWQEVKEKMMANDPKKAEIYKNMVDKTKRVDWNVEEIVTSQKNLMSILFLIHDFGTGEQYARALESLPQLRIILEELEEEAKDKDVKWQSRQAAKMRKQLKEQL